MYFNIQFFGCFKEQLTQTFQDVISSLKMPNVTNTTNVCPPVSPSQDSVLSVQSVSDREFSLNKSDQDHTDLYIYFT